MILRAFCIGAIGLSVCVAARADDCPSGSDGSDGALNCTTLGCPPGCDESTPCTVQIDLSLAADAPWDTPSPMPGQGVYDAEQWVVVFKYTTIDIPAGVTVTFKNHPKRPPVMWLAQGGVMIDGTVSVKGKNGASEPAPMFYAEPGPGGFAGGVRANDNPSLPRSGGFGPGGGLNGDLAAAYGCLNGGGGPPPDTYGSQGILPLIGGSGGQGGVSFGIQRAGGAGGGAILIATPTQIVLDGAIQADGGIGTSAGSGSGGAIRLVANSVAGSGLLRAEGLSGAGCGRIRVDAPVINLSDPGEPNWTSDFTCWPVFPPPDAPMLRATVVDGVAVPADPLGGIETEDAEIDNADPVALLIEATGIPLGTEVQVRIEPARGQDIIVTSSPLSDPDADGILTATAMIPFVSGKYEIQLRANW